MASLRSWLILGLTFGSLSAKAETYGKFADQPPPKTSLAQLTAATNGDSSAAVQLEGVVGKICEKKGCWMTLKDGSNEIRVTFVNYSFFVARKLEGQKVLVEGQLKRQKRSVDDQRHFLKDAGANAEALAKITQEATMNEFVASAVKTI